MTMTSTIYIPEQWAIEPCDDGKYRVVLMPHRIEVYEVEYNLIWSDPISKWDRIKDLVKEIFS